MFEEIGLPVRCGPIAMYPNSVNNSSILISPYAPLWALSFMVRTGIDEGIKKQFNEVKVALLTPEEVDFLYKLFTNSLNQAVKYLELNPIECHGNNHSVTQIKLASEMLSRLCIRLSTDQLDELFRLAADIYKMELFRNHPFLYNCIKHVFEKLFLSMPQSEILQKVPALLSLPIPTENFEAKAQCWPEPFGYVEWAQNTILDSNFDRSLWTKPISNLISIVNSIVKNGSSEARNIAAIRLTRIYEINGLNSKESELWGEALWERIDIEKGIPGETQLLDSQYLLLPEIEEGIAKKNFHKYLISKDFPRVIQKSITSDGKVNKSYMGHSTQIIEWLNGD